MVSRSRTTLATVLALATAAVTLAPAPRADAACPTVPCDCVGEGAQYRAVVLDRFFSNLNTVYGNVCAGTAELVEPSDDPQPNDLVGNLHVLAGASQRAVNARISRPDIGDALVVAGVVATGGGTVAGPVEASVIDTTGTHPGIASCQQASADVASASAAMALLPPTQILSRLVVDRPGTTTFPVGPGLNVIQVDNRIAIRDGVLDIALDPYTDAVVFNTRAFSMRRFTRIYVSGGSTTKVMINVPGPGPAVVLKDDAWVMPSIFAPARTARVTSARFASIFAERLQLRRALVDVIADDCPSPSGAFLDPPDAF